MKRQLTALALTAIIFAGCSDNNTPIANDCNISIFEHSYDQLAGYDFNETSGKVDTVLIFASNECIDTKRLFVSAVEHGVRYNIVEPVVSDDNITATAEAVVDIDMSECDTKHTIEWGYVGDNNYTIIDKAKFKVKCEEDNETEDE